MAFAPNRPLDDSVVVSMPDLGIKIENFESYSFASSFLNATDEFHFSFGGTGDAFEDLVSALDIGQTIVLTINDLPQATGRIEDIEIDADRNGGTVVHVTGYDFFGYVVDAHLDPRIKFSEGQSLFDVVSTVLKDFGFVTFAEDNDANRNIITGQIRGAPVTKKRHRPVKNFKIHQLKPYPNEGVFQFLSRVAQRHGLWIWPSADGTTAIIGKPDFDQAARGQLVRHITGDTSKNTILSGSAKRSGKNQPACIIASGHGGGGEFEHARLRAAIINPAVSTDISAIAARYPEIKFDTYATLLNRRDGASPDFSRIIPFKNAHARPLFLFDDESKDQAQLENFLVREMSLCLRRSLECHYVVAGHSLNGAPIAIDTILDVNDDRGRVFEELYVEGRTFSKVRGQTATTTSLNLLREHTMEF